MFFIAPNELYDILSPTDRFLLLTNGRVPVTYYSTSKEEYRAYYEKYCAAVQASQPVTWELTNPLRISITHVDTDVESQPVKGGQYKLLHASEPVINLMPLEINYEPNHLRVDVSSRNGTIFGLILSFPKVVFYAQDGFDRPVHTDNMRNRLIYDNIVKEVMIISRPCVFQDNKRVYRTRIRMTAKGNEIARYHNFLLQHNISLRLPTRKISSIRSSPAT